MFDLTTFLTSLAGSGLLSVGVAKSLSGYFADRWMVRYKSQLDKELEAYRDTLEQKRKRIEAELGHRTYVSKTQFDTEFNAVKDCFSALGKLRLSFNGMRPMIDWAPEDQNEKLKEFARRLDLFTERFNSFIDVSESARPFVPENVFEQFDACAKAAHLEIRHINEDIRKALGAMGRMDGMESLEKFSKAYYRSIELARQRFRQLSVVSD